MMTTVPACSARRGTDSSPNCAGCRPYAMRRGSDTAQYGLDDRGGAERAGGVDRAHDDLGTSHAGRARPVLAVVLRVEVRLEAHADAPAQLRPLGVRPLLR